MKSKVLIPLLILLCLGAGFNRHRMLISKKPVVSGSTLNADGYWKLDEASGTRADSSGNSQDLTDNATVGSAAGKISNAADFELDNSESLSRADSATLSLGADTDFTVWAWVNQESKAVLNSVIMGKTGTGIGDSTTEYLLQMNNASYDRFEFLVGNGTTFTNVVASTLGSPSLATWYFVVGWHDSTANTLNIQINNGTVDSVSYSNGTQDGTSVFKIGELSVGSRLFDGLIDEAGFKKRVFTADERTELYNSGSGKTCCPF